MEKILIQQYIYMIYVNVLIQKSKKLKEVMEQS
jgi:hypothetical protein